ncbi:MAG: GPR endopeptidase [Oscillospiraceae bacterium]|jgi:spore protease|nr:GPR endopeptidase [Oscillospiraceae bacterium]
MNIYKSTDLASEARSLWENSPERSRELSGVTAEEELIAGFRVETVTISDEYSAGQLGKPAGRYVSVFTEDCFEAGRTKDCAEVIAKLLFRLAAVEKRGSVLVAGLGNPEVLCDSLGPLVLDGVIVTRHLKTEEPQKFARFRSISALRTGVLGMSGIDTSEIIGAVLDCVKPDLLIVIDALAACAPERICNSIQLTDTGLVPGSGSSKAREALTPAKLGLPVTAIGVPTLQSTAAGGEGFILTRKDIDSKIRGYAKLIAEGVNFSLLGFRES